MNIGQLREAIKDVDDDVEVFLHDDGEEGAGIHSYDSDVKTAYEVRYPDEDGTMTTYFVIEPAF